MTQQYSTVKARMPRESSWWDDNPPSSIGLYPDRSLVALRMINVPHQTLERPFTTVPDIDLESMYWHASETLKIPKEKKVDPLQVSSKMLSLLCRANTL